jgi:hypothetical protein
LNYSKASDKRRFLRYEMLDYALVYSCEIEEPIKAVIVDIGLGGLQLRSREEIPVGIVCRIQIGRLNGDPLMLAGEVRHTGPVEESDLTATGIRFCPETHDERLAIAEYVHGVFQQQCDKLLL